MARMGATFRQGRRSPRSLELSDREAPVTSLAPLRRLVPFILRYPWRLGLTVLFLLVSVIATLTIPAIAGNAVDEGFISQNIETISTYAWALVFIGFVMAVTSAARFYFISALGERVVADLRQATYEHLLKLDAAFFDVNRVGELTSRLNGDVASIRWAVGSTVSLALRSGVTFAGAFVMMFLTNPVMGTVTFIVVPAIVIPVVWLGRFVRKVSRRTRDRVADLSAQATETLMAIKTIKAFTREPQEYEEYGAQTENSYRAELDRLALRAGLVAITTFIGVAGLVFLIWFGAANVLSGSITVGELLQFLIYAVMASGALTSMSEIFGTMQQLAGSTERIIELLETEPQLVTPAEPLALPEPAIGSVKFNHVSFGYETRDKDVVLKDVDFEVSPGETVALVGASGAGKSTVFGLLQRFYDVTDGSIEVDGIDVRQVDTAELRKRFAYVEQDSVMFAGTVMQNIRFGRPEASDEEVVRAAKAALVHDFVQDLDSGYESIVGERGVMLSGGQKQRVAIARALLKDAPILLLDEATSALDAESERLVQSALEHLMEGRTTLVIAHRLATIRNADRILVLENGRLIDEGKHETLIQRDGRYAELARLQFSA
ncbi:ABC transporter ATP-binding protein [Cucumibacter marinus]|uniref:ABC transporter ATP-binding protein n=1 Tax=Cucumibacter marinus TaxID=1121252 RepID=UPI001FDF91D8|nr:ABC transporter transmembrane domain-containing protein [Cucumibacter marinus]